MVRELRKDKERLDYLVQHRYEVAWSEDGPGYWVQAPAGSDDPYMQDGYYSTAREAIDGSLLGDLLHHRKV